jgi:hypothetical protein
LDNPQEAAADADFFAHAGKSPTAAHSTTSPTPANTTNLPLPIEGRTFTLAEINQDRDKLGNR